MTASHTNMSHCTICPRKCGIDRSAGQIGYCGQPATIFAARAALHHWEEPCISGSNGSGAVFFSGCNMRCVFCQNHDIARSLIGKEISISKLCDIFLRLQEESYAHNINLVTPTHYVPQIVQALELAKNRGLSIPIVYNSSAYETVDTLRMLDGLIDIYLPDLKYYSRELSARYSNAPDYFEVATLAISEMFRQVGEPVFIPNPYRNAVGNSRNCDTTDHSPNYDCVKTLPNTNSSDSPSSTCPEIDLSEEGLLQKGMIVRHLLLPGQQADSFRVIKYLYETYGNKIYLSIMNQYTPLPHIVSYPELNKRISDHEYDRFLDRCLELGVENAFLQYGDTAEESFIPAFDYEGLR